MSASDSPGSTNPLADLWNRLPGVIQNAPTWLVGAAVLTVPAIAIVVLTVLNQTTQPRTQRWVDLTGELQVISEPKPGPNDPGRCVYAIFAVFPEVGDATQYRGNVKAISPAHDVGISGPPFPQDAPYYVSKAADAGTHRVFVGGGSSGQGCGGSDAHKALFSIESLEVYTKRPSISGKVVDLDARPVAGRKIEVFRTANVTEAPCAADPRAEPDAVGTTRGDGTYEVYVDEAEYEVCPEGPSPFTPDVLEVSTEFIDGAIANFVLEGYKLSGTVLDDAKAGVADVSIAAAPEDPADPPATATTAADGTYQTYVAPGRYEVSAHRDVLAGKPGSVAVDLSSDDATADFTLVEGPITVVLDEPKPIGPGELGFSATASDVYGDELAYEWQFGDGETSADLLATQTHTYAKPGPYTVTLVVRNQHEQQSAPTTLELEIAAPTLEVAVHGSPTDTVVLDAETNVDLTVTLRAVDGVGPLKLALPQGWLTATGGVTRLTDPTLPPIPETLSLDPGAEQTYTIRLRGRENGPFTVKATPTGTDAADRPVTAEDTLEGSVGKALDVTMAFDPSEGAKLALKLAESSDENGDGFPDAYDFEPARITLVVKVRNTTASPMTNVALIAPETAPVHGPTGLAMGVHEGEAPAPFPIEIPTPLPDPMIGELAAGAEVERRYTLLVRNSGDFELITSALGHLESGDVSTPAAVALQVTTDVALVLEVQIGPTINQNDAPADQKPAPGVHEGDWYRVDGRFRNVTTGESVSVQPLRFGLTGNGVLYGPSKGLDQFLPAYLSYLAGVADYPTWAVAPTVDPKGDEDFVGLVGTKPLRLPRGVVQRQGSIVWLEGDPAGGTRTGPLFEATTKVPGGEPEALDPSRIRIVYGNGKWVDGSGVSHLRVDVTPEPPRQLDLDWDLQLGLIASKFSYNAVTGVGQGIANTPGFLYGLAKRGWNALTFDNYIEAVTFVGDTVNSVEYLILVWAITPPELRTAAVREAVLEVAPWIKTAPEDIEAAKQRVADAVLAQWNALAAWYDGAGDDVSQDEVIDLVEHYARPGGAIGELAGDYLGGEAFLRVASRIARLAPSILRAYEAGTGAQLEAESAARVEQALAAQTRFGDPRRVGVAPEVARILAGDERATAETAARLMGMDPVTFHNTLAMTDVAKGGHPIVMAIRARAEASLNWINSAIGASLKPFGMNPKNVDEIDLIIGGFRPGPGGYGGAGDLGSLVLAEPVTWDVALQRINSFNLSAAEKALARERWAIRWEEWYGVKPPAGELPLGWAEKVPPAGKHSMVEDLKLKANRIVRDAGGNEIGREGWYEVPVDGEIHWGGNVDTEAAVEAGFVSAKKRLVRLELRKVVKDVPDNALFDGKREYYEVWLDGKRVTGDQDLVHLGHLNGSLLSPEEAAIVGREGADLMGMQHWASSSAPQYRDRYIANHLWNADPARRGEPLLVIANGRATFGYFERTFELGGEVRFVNLRGAPIVLDKAAIKPGLWQSFGWPLFQPPKSPDLVTYIDPVSALQLANGIDAGAGAAPHHAIVSTRTSGSGVLRLGSDGSIERWTSGSGWAATPVEQVAKGANGSVEVALSTGLSADIAAGSTELPVYPPDAAAGPAAFGSDTAPVAAASAPGWFQAGDRIVINPGGQNEEIATVTALGSLILAAPTKHDHAGGEAIYLLPGGSDALPIVGAGLAALVAGVMVAGALVLARRRSRRGA